MCKTAQIKQHKQITYLRHAFFFTYKVLLFSNINTVNQEPTVKLYPMDLRCPL